MFDNPKRQYYLQLRQRVEEYCKDLRKKLQVFPNKIMRGASHLDIPDDEMMYYKNNSYSLKVQVKDCLKIYKFLQKKTKVNEYEKYFSIYKKECQGKKNVEEYKTAYNTAEMELVKEFNAQRDLLYRAVTIMKALTNYLKKKDEKEDKNKENVQSVEEYVNDISEACKSPLEARRFIKDVEKVAKRYDANYFIVSDGASATHNDNNEAIRYCRNALKEWETKNGYNPYEDWNNDINDFSNYKNNTLSILMNLNTKLNLYEYGLPINGVITDVTSADYYDKNYKSLSPKEFDTYKGGICWDYVRYQDAYLTKKRVRHVNYFIIDPHTFQTHTITISKINKKYYYIESSFKKYCGVYESNNVKNIFSFVTHNMKISNYNIFRITEFPKDHTPSNMYIRFMTDLSKMVLQGNTKNLKYIKLKNLQKPVKMPKDTRNIEEYVNDIDDMDLYFTEKDEVINHHFIPINITVESFNHNNIKYMNVKDKRANKYLQQDEDYKKYYEKIRNDYDGELAIDTDNDKLAGYIFVKTDEKENGFISPLLVVKKYRGKGIGKQLLEDGIKKYGAIDLVVKKDNKVAFNMYKKHGFEIIGKGNNKDEYWMKILNKTEKTITETTDEKETDHIKIIPNKSVDQIKLSMNSEQVTKLLGEGVKHKKINPITYGKYTIGFNIMDKSIGYIRIKPSSSFFIDNEEIEPTIKNIKEKLNVKTIRMNHLYYSKGIYFVRKINRVGEIVITNGYIFDMINSNITRIGGLFINDMIKVYDKLNNLSTKRSISNYDVQSMLTNKMTGNSIMLASSARIGI